MSERVIEATERGVLLYPMQSFELYLLEVYFITCFTYMDVSFIVIPCIHLYYC